MMNIESADVVRFWQNAGPDKWFAKDDAFDAAIKARRRRNMMRTLWTARAAR